MFNVKVTAKYGKKGDLRTSPRPAQPIPHALQGRRNISLSVWQRTAAMLFDDGWRIQEMTEKGNVLAALFFPVFKKFEKAVIRCLRAALLTACYLGARNLLK
jgi:hypothetical protein